ncbi:MAG: hypothetical protein WC337_04405 [Candidatus Muiribacteriota bacterium]
MKTSLLTVFLSIILTYFLCDLILKIAKKFNLLTYPEQHYTFSKPVLTKYSYIIITIVTIFTSMTAYFLSNTYFNAFNREQSNFLSLFLIMIISSLLFIASDKKRLASVYIALINTFIAYQNGILYGAASDFYIKLAVTFLWFLVFSIIFWTEKEFLTSTFLVNGIASITLFGIMFSLGQFFSANIMLSIGVSLLVLYKFSVWTKILPDNYVLMWISSVLSYLALVNNLKITVIALVLFFPLLNLMLSINNDSHFTFKLLKKGIPEKKINRYIFLVQILSGLAAFVIMFIKNEVIGFLLALTFFIFLYMFNARKT